MGDELWSITMVMTERQLKHLRQACIDYATARYEARIRLPGRHGANRGALEIVADDVERLVFRACEIKYPMGRVPEECVR